MRRGVPGDHVEEFRAPDHQQHRRLDGGDGGGPRDITQQGDLADAIRSRVADPDRPVALADQELARLEDVVRVAGVALGDEHVATLDGDPARLAGKPVERAAGAAARRSAASRSRAIARNGTRACRSIARRPAQARAMPAGSTRPNTITVGWTPINSTTSGASSEPTARPAKSSSLESAEHARQDRIRRRPLEDRPPDDVAGRETAPGDDDEDSRARGGRHDADGDQGEARPPAPRPR